MMPFVISKTQCTSTSGWARVRGLPTAAHDLADALRRRDAPGDAARAADLDGNALASARPSGCRCSTRGIEAREAEPTAPAWPAGIGMFRREGEYWSIAFEGRAVRMKHSKGLAYLATLLRRSPGRSSTRGPRLRGRHRHHGGGADEGLRIEADGGAGPRWTARKGRISRARRRAPGGHRRGRGVERPGARRPFLRGAGGAGLAAGCGYGLGGRDRPASSSANVRASASLVPSAPPWTASTPRARRSAATCDDRSHGHVLLVHPRSERADHVDR